MEDDGKGWICGDACQPEQIMWTQVGQGSNLHLRHLHMFIYHRISEWRGKGFGVVQKWEYIFFPKVSKHERSQLGKWPRKTNCSLRLQLPSWLGFSPLPVSEKWENGGGKPSPSASSQHTHLLWLFNGQTDRHVSPKSAFHFTETCENQAHFVSS